MHEFSIARALVDLACEQARSAGLSSVTRVKCRVGVLRQIEPDMLDDAFRAAGAGTSCEAAELAIELMPLRAACSRCGREFDISNWDWDCPDCGAMGEPIESGGELELTFIQGKRLSPL